MTNGAIPRTSSVDSIDEVSSLRNALARRDRQLAATVHELRTPLASVITALELLRSDGLVSSGDADPAELTEIASIAAHHLAFLVDDVLDEQALADGTLRLAIGDHCVAELLTDGLRTLSVQASRAGVAFHVEPIAADVAVRTDPRRFAQILFNLVGNALKFSRRGDAIHLRIDTTKDRARFSVVDHGPGVPAELRDRLFARLSDADGATTKPGSGLGLFVAARIVQQMGGTIGHEHPAGGGSKFWFDLPRA